MTFRSQHLSSVIGYGLILSFFIYADFSPYSEWEALEKSAIVIFVFEFLSVHAGFMMAPFAATTAPSPARKSSWLVYMLLGFYLLFALGYGFLTRSIVAPLSFMSSTWAKASPKGQGEPMVRAILLVVLLLLTSPIIGLVGPIYWGLYYYGILIGIAILQMFNLFRIEERIDSMRPFFNIFPDMGNLMRDELLKEKKKEKK